MNIDILNKFGIDEIKSKQLLQQINNYINNEVNKKVSEEKNKYNFELMKLKQKSIIENELILAGAKNIKAVFALLNFEDDDYQNFDINNIKEQISKLKQNENTKFLFFNKENEFKLKGFIPFENKIYKQNSFENLGYEELCHYYEQFNKNIQ